MRVPVAVRQVGLRTAISVYFTLQATVGELDACVCVGLWRWLVVQRGEACADRPPPSPSIKATTTSGRLLHDDCPPICHSLTHSSVHRHRHDVFNPAAVTPAQTRPARLPACAFLLVLQSLKRSLKRASFEQEVWD